MAVDDRPGEEEHTYHCLLYAFTFALLQGLSAGTGGSPPLSASLPRWGPDHAVVFAFAPLSLSAAQSTITADLQEHRGSLKR